MISARSIFRGANRIVRQVVVELRKMNKVIIKLSGLAMGQFIVD